MDMRTFEMPELNTDAEREDFYQHAARVDWKESPDQVLAAVNGLLTAHGLEIVLYNDESDSYCFGVQALGAPEKEPEPETLHQQLMNAAYKRWQENNWSQAEFHDSLSAAERFAVFTGNLNYQVCNGGWMQWHGNEYDTPEVRSYLIRNLPKTGPRGMAVLEMMKEAFEIFAVMDEYRDDEIDEELREKEDALCSSYYALNTEFMAECEAYLKSMC